MELLIKKKRISKKFEVVSLIDTSGWVTYLPRKKKLRHLFFFF